LITKKRRKINHRELQRFPADKAGFKAGDEIIKLFLADFNDASQLLKAKKILKYS
jgi:hypothetical protein